MMYNEKSKVTYFIITTFFKRLGDNFPILWLYILAIFIHDYLVFYLIYIEHIWSSYKYRSRLPLTYRNCVPKCCLETRRFLAQNCIILFSVTFSDITRCVYSPHNCDCWMQFKNVFYLNNFISITINSGLTFLTTITLWDI